MIPTLCSSSEQRTLGFCVRHQVVRSDEPDMNLPSGPGGVVVEVDAGREVSAALGYLQVREHQLSPRSINFCTHWQNALA